MITILKKRSFLGSNSSTNIQQLRSTRWQKWLIMASLLRSYFVNYR